MARTRIGHTFVNVDLLAIKGGGAAHTRKKEGSASARRFLVAADESKYAEKLSRAVPVEVLAFAAWPVEERLMDLGGAPVLRLGKMKDGPVITDNGNLVVDVDFGVIEDPEALAAKLCPIPGVVEHGIFDTLDELHLARAGEVEIIKRK